MPFIYTSIQAALHRYKHASEVCKTFTREFDSHPRLQSLSNLASFQNILSHAM
jgi:hypothetical protein